MTWPSSDVTTTALDAGTDTPPRAEILSWAQKFNQLRAHVSTFMQGVLAAVDAAAARAALGLGGVAVETTVPLSKGGTNSTTAAAARTALGLEIGANVLAPNGNGAALTGIGRRVGQIQSTVTGAANSWPNTIPWDDTIPQIGEGLECFNLPFTPMNAASKLRIRVDVQGTSSSPAQIIVALFRDSVADALAANASNNTAGGGQPTPISFEYEMVAGTTSEIIFRVRAGSSLGSFTLNGTSGVRRLGGAHVSGITITEYLPAT